MIYANKVISKIKNFRNYHKFVPTNENPITIKNTIFYSDYFVNNNKKIYYTSIQGITNKYSEKYVNHMRTEIDLLFKLHFKVDDKFEIIDLSYSLEIWGWRKRETTTIVLNYLKEITFKNRFKIHLDEINTTGFFTYSNYKISEKGDVYVKENVMTNIYEENKNGNVWYGVSYSSPLGRNTQENPYLLKIKNGIKNPKLFQKRDIDITTEYNKDVIDIIFKEIIEYGKVLNINNY